MTKITIINYIIAAVCLIDGLVARQIELSTSTPYTNVQRSTEVMEEEMNIYTNLKMCITNQTNSTESKELIKSMANLTKNFYEVMNCTENPYILVSYLYNIKNISSQIAQTMKAMMHNIIGIVCNISQCMSTKIPLVKVIKKIVSNIINVSKVFMS
ncbi:PREDICTED: uncharacterized protein LOC105150875 [Acromyrmex echinatior]|uniref:uncharacterized protein LOC105150875 n=1 Tax=Acromyrmex echinatior TaxID=103372 RepID=UPI000580C252|nr:PREDICTED: uncharacterized protein LOC105150875 [Acromyrmex echinatior]